MSAFTPFDPAFQRLEPYLGAAQFAALSSTASLPPDEILAACVRLREALSATASYIPSRLVREQLAAPQPGRVHGEYWSGSILFADLSGFTALSGQLATLGKQGAEEISAIINNLFSALVEEIHRYQGGLLKFGGDALTAFFDAEQLADHHALMALQAALRMQERMQSFADLPTRAGTFTLRLRIGVHSGRVFAAQVGDQAHIELVVTGHDINRVATAQEIASPGEVVVSAETFALTPNALVDQRDAGFYRVYELPDSPQALPDRPTIAPGDGGLDELLLLATRLDALRPYLPYGLPRRFLEADETAADLGEFRPVTILFANFADFSTVLDRIGADAETATQILNAYYRRAQSAIHNYGGIVNKVDMYTHGDKLMALFGAPIAHEDDPLRAVLAALELRRALEDANTEIAQLSAALPADTEPLRLTQKIGMNTGVVFAGKVGSVRRHEYTVMGQPVNLSARLMSVAPTGSIVLSPALRRIVEHQIEVSELPPVLLKGIIDPVPLAEARGLLAVARPIVRSLARAPLVGRSNEFAVLRERSHMALFGTGRIVALAGEPGAGKTRLIDALIEDLLLHVGFEADDVPPFQLYRVECQSYAQNTPYAALNELLRQQLSLSMIGNPAELPAYLERQVQELVPDLARFTPLLGDVMTINLPDTPLTASLTPEQRHDRMLDLVIGLLQADSQRQPLILIWDDLQWIDASSLDLLLTLARQVDQHAILILLGYRPESMPAEPWRELEYCTFLPIGELSSTAGAELARELLGGEIPDGLTNLLAHAEGNPFFIEELVRNLVETGALQQAALGWRLMRAVDTIAVPDSIDGLITARLDRLEERLRGILQVASVIGTRFAYPLLTRVLTDGEHLNIDLGRLSEAALILREEFQQELAYLFKHTLTREVAYESILYARRRELHRRVARQIEQSDSERLEEQLALLARHYLLAEAWEPALNYHLRAGRQAQRRYANREAIALLTRALEILDRIGDPALDIRTELHERLGVVHALIGEYDQALGEYNAVLALYTDTTGSDERVRLHHHIARVYEKRGEFEPAFDWVERALALPGAEQTRAIGRCVLLGAGLHMRQGHFQEALEWGARALAMSESHRNELDQAQALKLMGNAYSLTGDNPRALELLQQSLAIYARAGNLDGLSYAHNDLAVTYYELGNLEQARTHYEAGAQIKQQIGDIYGEAFIISNLGEISRLRGDLETALAQYRQSLAIFERLRSLYTAGVLHMNLGATQILNHAADEAERHLQRAGELFQQAGSEDFLPELERYYADLALLRNNAAAARLLADQALATAQRLEAPAEEGMTRRTLARALIQSGEYDAAWAELDRSLAILEESAPPYETARTRLAIAALAPQLGRIAEGRAAFDAALATLRDLGARLDLAEAERIAAVAGYGEDGDGRGRD